MFRIKIIFFLFFCNIIFSKAQNINEINKDIFKWFVNADCGVQMSGIKSEDFITSNYSPLLVISVGQSLSNNLGFRVGYQGNYFYSIADNYKHFYDFYFIKAVLNPITLFEINNQRNYNFLLDFGLGYFQNHFYKDTKVHSIIGFSNEVFICDFFALTFNTSAIIGWDIYQGNKDILPSLSLGAKYVFF